MTVPERLRARPVVHGDAYIAVDPARRNVIIIALTANAMKGNQRKAVAAGCDDYMSEPIDIDAIPRVVAEHLARGASSGADR